MSVSTQQVQKTRVIGDVWMTRDDAAARLQVAVRTVDRYIDDGHLRTKRDKPEGARQATTMVHAEDVELLRTRKETAVQLRPQSKPVIDEKPGYLPSPKLWMTIDEAAEYSGLPAAYLRRLIDRGELPARNVFDGTNSAAHSWRVKWSELDALPGLFKAQ